MLAILIVILFLFFGIKQPAFIKISNIINMTHQMAIMAIIAFSATAVLIGRGTDLSVGSNLALSAVVGGLAYQAGIAPVVCILIMLLVGSAVGAVNGFLVTKLGINAFIATFGIMSVCRGLSLTLVNARGISITDPTLIWLGSAMIFGIPVSVFVTAFMLIVWHIILNRTILGRYIYSTGGNFEATNASAISGNAVRFLTHILCGTSVGLGAILLVGRVESAQPLSGIGLEFDVLSAVIIGGTLLSGGAGSVAGTLLGSILITIIKTGLIFMNVPQQIIYIVTGAIILIAVLSYQENLKARVAAVIHQSFSNVKMGAAGTVTDKRHILSLKNVTKEYAGFAALESFTIDFASQEVTALIGENGAGKSTMVKVLSGVAQPTKGHLELDGEPINFHSPREAYDRGIGVIHQHYSLVPELTIAENLFLGKEPTKCKLLNRRYMKKFTKKKLQSFGIELDPEQKVSILTTGQKQLIELLKATMGNPWLIIMDEPTSSLSSKEVEKLYELITRLTAEKVGILFISHKMDEVYKICTRGVVMRDGCLVGDVSLENTAPQEIVNMMVGRNISNIFAHKKSEIGKTKIQVKNLCDGHFLKNINLNVKEGEIVALVGLMGAGRTEVIRCIFGLDTYSSGEIELNGAKIEPTPKKMVKNHVAYIPEDRHEAGLATCLSVKENISMVWIRNHNKAGFIEQENEKKLVDTLINEINIKPHDPLKQTQFLSGGNQQKVVLSKWLAINPEILLLDDPTRGVDVGAKAEIHQIIGQYKQKGASILMVSSELTEALGVADRIIVMYEGETVKELPSGTSEKEIMYYALGMQYLNKEVLQSEK